MMLSFFVAGLPQTKGSTRGFVGRSKKTGKRRVFLTNDNPKNKPWAALVAHEARAHGQVTPMTGPVYVDLTFFLEKPKRPKHPVFPITRPDVDKLTRSILDALKVGGVYRDDGQVCVMLCRKLYATDKPGVAITVKET
jgi:crossover junction endodeoxyribonuclease RusA